MPPPWLQTRLVFLTALTLALAAILKPTLVSFELLRPIYDPVADVKDWNDRAELYDGPFTPLRETLVFAVTRSSMMEPNGFTLALFSSPTSTTFNPIPCLVSECASPTARIAIDALGLVWRVPENDYVALRALAESTHPFAGHSWSIDVPYTCQSSDQLILPNSDMAQGAYKSISVWAFAPGRRRLEGPVKISDGRVFLQLPEEIDTFLRMALQRAYGETWGPRVCGEGKKVIRGVMALLNRFE
jgi:hypothetical protein